MHHRKTKDNIKTKETSAAFKLAASAFELAASAFKLAASANKATGASAYTVSRGQSDTAWSREGERVSILTQQRCVPANNGDLDGSIIVKVIIITIKI